MNGTFLGQLIPAPADQGLTTEEIQSIKKIITEAGGITNCRVEVFVTSANALKIQASKDAIKQWLVELFPGETGWNITEEGFEVPSEVDEQPHGIEITKKGALNRLNNMKVKLVQKKRASENTITILVSLENGLIPEKHLGFKNPDTFLDKGVVWVDRCCVIGEIWFQKKSWNIMGFSEGVTTPLNEVMCAAKTNWSKTAGSFIAEKYGWNAKDWHIGICGKGRQVIMTEAIRNSFGSAPVHKIKNEPNEPMEIELPVETKHVRKSAQQSFSLPARISDFKPDTHHHYFTESIDFFVPIDIKEMLTSEKQTDRQGDAIENSQMWRGIYAQITQPDKMGADGVSPSNSSGIILTEDLLVGYFDQVENQDVLHIVLLWAKTIGESKEQGWVLPGKRDRAYDTIKNGDISIEDANYSLVEKEIGLDRSSVAYHVVLGYFDDRKREQRMKSSGFVSFVLLNKKPQLIPSKRIGIPLNGLVQLAKREIRIPYDCISIGPSEKFGLVRNHDSLLLNIFETTKFYHVMDKVRINRARYRQQLVVNPHLEMPEFPELDNGYECQICMDLLVGTKIICTNGHSICGICLDAIKQTNNPKCPSCRKPILAEPIANIVLEGIVQSQYPTRYAERYHFLSGRQPVTWKDDPTFNGKYIQYF